MQLVTEKIKIKELLSECSQVVSPLLNKKPAIQYTKYEQGNVPKKFTGDKTKVKQILVNLLSNAVKFTNSGRITVKVASVAKQNIKKSAKKPSMIQSWTDPACSDFLRFSVKDTGMGVHENDLETIFSAFEQVRLAK